MTNRHPVVWAVALTTLSASSLFGDFDPVTRTNGAEAVYFAPASALTYRLWQSDGVFREFELTQRNPGEFEGALGWHGTVDGDRATVFSGQDAAEPFRLDFERGRLRHAKRGDRAVDFAVSPLPLRPEPIGILWPQPCSREEVEKVTDIWKTAGRFRLFYNNPNRTGLLFAELGLLALALVFVRRQELKVCGLLLAGLFFLLTVQTGSRGGVAAFVTGVLLLALFRLHLRRCLSGGGRRFFIVSAVVTLVAGGFIFASGPRRVTHKLLSVRDGSNRVRLRVLREFPRMVADAPGGWGWYAGGLATGPGKAYSDWYQPQKRLDVMATLVSDHLTQLARFGRFGRLVYAFGWLSLVLLLAVAACRKASPLPLALWAAFLIATGCNRVMGAVTLWIVPVGVTLALAPSLGRALGVRRSLCVLSAAMALSVLLLAGIVGIGRGSRGRLAIRTEANRIYVKDTKKPRCWVVDDGCVLGGGLAANEIRDYYRRHRKASGIGYVRDVFDLPLDAGRLVLAGRAGWDFLMGLNDGRFPEDFQMPKSIVFLSPPFPPQAVPELLLKNVKVRLVIGEFAAAFFGEYRNPPPWVKVVPGAELYVPNWMRWAAK